MKSSPIKLNSKSKSKFLASKSPSVINKSVKVQNESILSPVHTLGPKVSHRKIISNFTTSPQSTNNSVLRSGSPINKPVTDDSL